LPMAYKLQILALSLDYKESVADAPLHPASPADRAAIAKK